MELDETHWSRQDEQAMERSGAVAEERGEGKPAQRSGAVPAAKGWVWACSAALRVPHLLRIYPVPHLKSGLADLCALMNTYHPLFPF